MSALPSYLTCALLLAMTTAWCYRQRRSWMSPDCIAGLLWVTSYVVHGFLCYKYYYSWSIAFPMIAVIMFQIGVHLSAGRTTAESEIRPVKLLLPRAMIVLGMISGLVSLVSYLGGGGMQVSQFVSEGSEGFQESAREAATKHYQKDSGLDEAKVGKVCQAIVNCSAFIAGIYFVVDPNGYGRVRWPMLILLPALLRTAMTTSRGAFLVPGINITAGYILGLILSAREYDVKLGTIVRRGMIAAPILLLLILAPVWIRWKTDSSQLFESLDKTRSWFGGYIPAYSVWYDEYYSPHPEVDNYAMIAIVGKQFGLWEGEIPDEYIGFYDFNGVNPSNAPTIFRWLVGQMSSPGCVVFMLVWGCAAGIWYRQTQAGPSASTALLAASFGTTIWSLNAFYFSASTRTFGVFLFIAYVVAWNYFAQPLVEDEHAMELCDESDSQHSRPRAVSRSARSGNTIHERKTISPRMIRQSRTPPALGEMEFASQ